MLKKTVFFLVCLVSMTSVISAMKRSKQLDVYPVKLDDRNNSDKSNNIKEQISTLKDMQKVVLARNNKLIPTIIDQKNDFKAVKDACQQQNAIFIQGDLDKK